MKSKKDKCEGIKRMLDAANQELLEMGKERLELAKRCGMKSPEVNGCEDRMEVKYRQMMAIRKEYVRVLAGGK